MSNERKVVSNVGYYHSHKYHSMEPLHHYSSEIFDHKSSGKMNGTKRVILFCILTAVLPTVLLIIPLYLRRTVYRDVAYAVTESDVLEINDGISSIFCSEHSLTMNESFNAFQVSRKPETTSYRKHIRLKKSMTLPDDTLEYWGFYLLKGATVALSVCSRFEGSSILVVKGERNLRTCGMLEHNQNKALTTGIYLPEADRQVKIIFESHAQEINSKEAMTSKRKEFQQYEKTGNVDLKENQTESVDIKSGSGFNQENVRNDVGNNFTENYGELNATINSDSLTESNLTMTANAAETTTEEQLKNRTTARRMRHVKKKVPHRNHRNQQNSQPDHSTVSSVLSSENVNSTEKIKINIVDWKNEHRKQQKRIKELEAELQAMRDDAAREEEEEEEEDQLPKQSFNAENTTHINGRRKRNQDPVDPPALLDQGIKHGGNAVKNLSHLDDDSSISSFENGLLTCYNGHVLLSKEFEPSDQCMNVSYLMNVKHMQTIHDVTEDGYYYYIFYSDNDIVSNDIHAVFDIYKPTLQYENVTKACINQTECSFSLDMTSSDRVIVEVPTRDGIDHEIDDIFLLVSVCHPRMGIYAVFPIAVLIFILGCAFV